MKKEEENINKNMEEKRNKIIEYNKIIKGQELLNKEIENNLIYKNKFEYIKKELDKKINNKIYSYINQIQKEYEEIKIKNNELIKSYINKLNKYENERKLGFKEKNEKYEKLKLDFIKIINSNVKYFNEKCKKCGDFPIKGILYECSKCEGYYLCEKCEEINYLDKKHPHNFIKIRESSSNEEIENKIKN